MSALPHGWGFPPEQTAEIRAALNAAGDGARLFITPHGDPHAPQIIASVRAPGDVTALDGGGGTNNSFRCPPATGCP